MVDSSSERSQLVWSDADQGVRVRVTPGAFKNAQRICEHLRGDIRISGEWKSAKLPSVVVLHLVCNGAGPTAIIKGKRDPEADVKSESDFREMTRLHAALLEENQCFVVTMGEDTEVFLAPVKTETGTASAETFVFWAYATMRGAVRHVTEMVETGRVPLIFDLDETLVLAHTIFSLKTHPLLLSNAFPPPNRATPLSPDSAEEYSPVSATGMQGRFCRRSRTSQEGETLAEDIAQLTSFMERDRIEVNGITIHASPERVTGEEGFDFLRPVVRLPGKIFTRIDPKRNETSMVIRIREGWEAMSAYLRGEGTTEKRQRFKIWVCTAAERGYALEAWRLLDPTGELIPKEEIGSRLICAGKQKKSLFRTFGLGPLHEEPIPRDILCPKKKLGPLCDGHSEMAMAIIADDRVDVWEKRNQEQILKVVPFEYPCIETQSPGEIQRMLGIVQSVRSRFYFELMEQIGPAVREMWKIGMENEEAVLQLQEKLKRAASIAPVLAEFGQPSVGATPPETTGEMPEASLKPNDRRQLGTNKVNRLENGRLTKLPVIAKKRRNQKRQKKKPTEIGRLDEGPMEVDLPPTPPSETFQSELIEEQMRTAAVARSEELQPGPSAQWDVGCEALMVGTSSAMRQEESMDEVQMSTGTVPPPTAVPDVTQLLHQPVFQDSRAPVIPGLFDAVKALPQPLAPALEPLMSMMSVPMALPQPETVSAEPLFQAVTSQVPHPVQPQRFVDPNTAQILAMPPVQEPSSNNPGAQLRLLPGKVMLLPQNPPSGGEASTSRYTLVQLSDGRLILQPVPPPAPAREPTPLPTQPVQGQGLNFLLHSEDVIQSPPVMQSKQWNRQWAAQNVHLSQSPHQIAGIYPPPVNLPSHMLVNSQPSIQSGLQPHQLEVPQMAMVQQSSSPSAEQTALRALLMVRSSQPPAQSVEQEAKLEYASLSVSSPGQQLFFPVTPPPPPPPVSQQMTDGPNFLMQSRSHRGKLRGGLHTWEPGKRVKLVGSSEPSILRSSPALRGRRGQGNDRRSSQRKTQNLKNKGGTKKKKQGVGQMDVSQFNPEGYMKQVADELDDQEEGEIRE